MARKTKRAQVIQLAVSLYGPAVRPNFIAICRATCQQVQWATNQLPAFTRPCSNLYRWMIGSVNSTAVWYPVPQGYEGVVYFMYTIQQRRCPYQPKFVYQKVRARLAIDG